MSSPGPTTTRKGSGSAMRTGAVVDHGVGCSRGAGRLGRTDRGCDREGRKDERADCGRGDARKTSVLNISGLLNLVCVHVPPTIGGDVGN